MKSKVFGRSAIIALAVLAVCGTLFTGCYEKDDIVEPEPLEAIYWISGSVMDASNSRPIPLTAGDVKIGGDNALVTGSNFRLKVTEADKLYHIEVKAIGQYKAATREVFVIKIPNGHISHTNADIVLYDASSHVTEPPINTNPVEPSPEMLNTTEFPNHAERVGQTIRIVESVMFNTPTTNPYAASYERYTGFVLPSESVKSRAFNLELYFARNIEAETAKKYVGNKFSQFIKNTALFTINTAGDRLLGYDIVRIFEVYQYEFELGFASAIWEERVTIEPIFDTHDSHDKHGKNPNAGGGEGGSSIN